MEHKRDDDTRFEHTRQSDATIARLEQKLDDLIVKLEDHLLWANGEVVETHSRLNRLEKLILRIEVPAKVIGWTIVTMTTGTLIALGAKVFAWLEYRIHR